ncbi:hypothetical protein BDZ91DRAFT_708640 [Kalaharituber pfeilii]|nr:hypothetical protein BDZ91DRAFT_708640 [Kalaharituber pfeilii]
MLKVAINFHVIRAGLKALIFWYCSVYSCIPLIQLTACSNPCSFYCMSTSIPESGAW